MSSRLVRTGGQKLPGLEDSMEEKKKSMTKDEMIMELMELLKANGRPKQAADVFESSAYVDMLESKLDQMTNELELNLGLIKGDFYLDGRFLQKRDTFCKGYC